MKKIIVVPTVLALCLLLNGCQLSPMDSTEMEVTVEEVEIISKNEDIFHGWPTVIMTNDGDLLAVYSGGRVGHVCPFGRVELMYSKDNGKTWSDPEILANSPMDDRDAGIVETDKGTLLVTWFTSTVFVNRRDTEPWQKATENMTSANCEYPEIKKFMEEIEQKGDAPSYPTAQWMIRSEDGGKSWSEPYGVPLMSPNGPKLTRDNRLLWAGKDGSMIGIVESFDDGRTWEIIGEIPNDPRHNPSNYHELDIIDCKDGTLIAQIRCHNTPGRETLQTRSDDGGKTWTVPRSIGVWGFPSHLLKLENDMLLMTYSDRGHRRTPPDENHIYVRFSNDCGKNWSSQHSLSETTGDFGYPTTAILSNNKLLTLWYQSTPENNMAQLYQSIWKYN